MKTFKTISLGCKVNSYECAAVSSYLISKGYKEDNQNPDVIIINTCSVTETADQKSRQHIRKMKKDYPSSIIVVMGCYSQKSHHFISEEIGADIVTGTNNRIEVLKQIENYEKTRQKIDICGENPRNFEYEELGTSSYFENVRTYLKISDGCNNFCSYCLIPYVRGKLRSRKKDEIIKEAKFLISKGYHEIILAGIHVGGYGEDFNDGYRFSDLVDDLTKIDGLDRLTISSIEESEVDDKLIDLLKERKNIARHLHIPLQSGSERILKSMNRKYNKEEFLSKIKLIQKECPDIMIASDVITGFPGETEEEFLETYNFIKECNFSMLHVFPYSKREGTAASLLPNQVDPTLKKERARRLIALSNALWEAYTTRFLGKPLHVLVEAYNEDSKMVNGLSEHYISVSFPGSKNDINTIIEYIYTKKS